QVSEEALRIAEMADEPASLALAYHGIGHVYFLRADFAAAIDRCGRCVELCRASQIGAVYWRPASELAYSQAMRGHGATDLRLLEEAVEQATSARRLQAPSLTQLGELYLLVGRRDDAVRAAAGALQLAQLNKERGFEVGAFRLLGEIAAHADPSESERAESYYRQALALADELGMRPLVAHCHLGLGTLYQ